MLGSTIVCMGPAAGCENSKRDYEGLNSTETYTAEAEEPTVCTLA
jgi:hypothetical protein